MKQLILAIFFLPLVSTGQEYLTFNHSGSIREYILYKPANLPDDAPLVFVLHGYNSEAAVIMEYSQMNALADSNGFAVCYPQGRNDFLGTSHWNAHLEISNVDDIGFLSELAFFLQREHQLAPSQTFACGMSNGGFMSYTLACEKPEIFKAIASVTGTMSGRTWSSCDPENPISVMQISGTLDDVVPMDGSMGPFGGWGGAPAMTEVVKYWANTNGLDQVTKGTFPDTDNNDGSTVISEKYTSDTTSHQVWFYTVIGGGHDWPGAWGNKDIQASQEIWEFFDAIRSNTTTHLGKISPNRSRRLVKIVDIWGREVRQLENQLQIYLYDDGTSERRVIVP